jgi:hypothetical protein
MFPRNIRTDGFVHPCAPIRAAKPPVGLGWVHEIKHDGYRLIVRRDGLTVRLFTRNGYDWTDRYPAIAAAAAKLLAKSFTLDGEAVVCGADGVAVFDALHRRGKVGEAILQAFDLLELNGQDFRPLSLGERKKRLARLLARVTPGIALCEQHRRGRRARLPASLRDGPGGHRVETPGRALQIRSIWGLDQDQELGQPGDGETSAGAMVIVRWVLDRGPTQQIMRGSSDWEQRNADA